MSGFLSGLAGALRGLTGGARGGGGGLLGGLDAALAGTPGGASAPAGAGGMGSDLGDFRLTARGGGLSAMPAQIGEAYTPAPVEKKPGFFARINTPDATTGLSFVDRLDRLGRRMQDITQGGDSAKEVDARAAGRLAAQRNKLLQAQIDEIFADDPRMRFLMKANPEKAAEALANVYKSRHETRVVGEGSAVGDGAGMTWMAPKYGQDDGYAYSVGPDGFRWGEQRGATHAEQETLRHNKATEALGQGNLDVSRGQLGLGRDRLNFDRFKDGRDAPGGSGGGGDLSTMSTADLIAALRGAR